MLLLFSSSSLCVSFLSVLSCHFKVSIYNANSEIHLLKGELHIALLNSPGTHFTHRIYALVHFITKKKINMSDFQSPGGCRVVHNLKF